MVWNGMEGSRDKYILLHDREGYNLRRTNQQVRRGELLEALPEAEQTSDLTLAGIEDQSLRLDSQKENLARLSNEDANLLVAIPCCESRYQTFINKSCLPFGRRLSPGSAVFVSVKGIADSLAGVVRYKGEIPSYLGTMFGVELIENPGEGTSDGTFGNKRYFDCAPDSGVFVGLDDLRPREKPESKPLQGEKTALANIRSRLLSFSWKGKKEQKSPCKTIDYALQTDERVVTFREDYPVRGTVRYIGEEKDANGNARTIVGLEMDEWCDQGTGRRNGIERFVCKKGFGWFVPIESVVRESDFDAVDVKEDTENKESKEEDHIQEFACNDELLATSMNFDDQSSVFREKDERDENIQTQLTEIEQQLEICQGQLREKQSQEHSLQEQLREKIQQEENLQRQLKEMEQQLTRIEEQLREKDDELENSEKLSSERREQLTNVQRQLCEIELQEATLHELIREKTQQDENSKSQLREIEQQLRNIDEQEQDLQRQRRSVEQRLADLQEQLIDKEDEAENLQRRVAILEGQLGAKDREMNELETTLSTAQQALSEPQRQQSPDWVIFRDQVQLTDKFLGRGGWGSVVEGKYCGCAVAVKRIHELILSPHNRNLFEREMDIASRCRHPCLLQFIGATNDRGSPLFLTELMESTLRTLLEQRPLSEAEVFIISQDVAQALNYLHQKKPSPIIHRDISSANVLLWRQGDQWRGKVSDYGTANFMQHTMTAAPGAYIYIAPEALTPNQTVKVDVYSFGVLLCEMCIQELPDPDKRDQQIAKVINQVLEALIRGCVQPEPGERPNMEDIVKELSEPA